jgi:hypothetical protein
MISFYMRSRVVNTVTAFDGLSAIESKTLSPGVLGRARHLKATRRWPGIRRDPI